MKPEAERIGQTEFLHSIEGHFTERSITTDGLWALAVFAGLAFIFAFAWWLQRRKLIRQTHNPAKLFRSVLRELNLPVPQRDVIIRIAKDAELEHPLSLLICQNTYRNHATNWMAKFGGGGGGKGRATVEERVAHAEVALFGWQAKDADSTEMTENQA